MSADSNYIDTSALAKWYLNEEQSDEFSHWIQEATRVVISDLTQTEMRCLLARRRRMEDLDRESETRIYATFQNDISQGYLTCPPIGTECFNTAAQLIDQLSTIPLRTLDVLHLAIASQLEVNCIATADCIFAAAAKSLGFETIEFSDC